MGPNGCRREIEIGDVGYIDGDGAFCPLFNVTYAADDERNAGRLPTDGFVPLRYNASAIDPKEKFLSALPVHGCSVKSRRVAVEATVCVPSYSDVYHYVVNCLYQERPAHQFCWASGILYIRMWQYGGCLPHALG